MAITIEWSPNQNEIKLTLYDPNDTLRVRRVVIPCAEHLRYLNIEEVMDQEDIDFCFPSQDFCGVLTSVEVKPTSVHNPENQACQHSLSGLHRIIFSCAGRAKKNQNPDIVNRSEMGESLLKIYGPLNPSTLHLLLSRGYFHHNFSKQVLTEQLNKLDKRARLNLLLAKDHENVPGMFMAMQNGHANSVSAYITCIMSSPFNDEVKQTLLAAKDPDGISGLHIAMQIGHHDCVHNYVKNILASSMSNRAKQALLIAKSSNDGIPGLYFALQEGHSECVRTYMRHVLKSPLSDDEKQMLLSGTCEDGSTGLLSALQDGHSECVRVYIEEILASSLSETIKSALLSPPFKGKRLITQHYTFNVEAFDVYKRVIMKSRLSRKIKRCLLTM